jgi:hypothetical protein
MLPLLTPKEKPVRRAVTAAMARVLERRNTRGDVKELKTGRGKHYSSVLLTK